MNPLRTWIVVADGAHARIFLSEGAGKALVLHPIRDMKIEIPATRDLGTDRPGRVHNRGGVRHAMSDHTDRHEEEKEKFAKQVAGILDEAASGKLIDRLVLVAPAKMLGNLRRALGKPAAALVQAEVPKDLVKADAKSLLDHLSDILAH